MSERRGPKALELWCRRITEGYPGVNVQNMTTSWRDGLAFCAMIHHFRPDLIDFDSLNKDDVYGNNELAFRIAEQHLGIPALLDAEDMASCTVPDRLSILTYLSQFYQHFGGASPSRVALSRTTENTNQPLTPTEPSPTKTEVRLGMRRDLCTICGLPVFLAEKLLISRITYHRTCFKCARCKNQLTLGNYYETEEGDYCCEQCPDEEAVNDKFNKMEDESSSSLSLSLNYNKNDNDELKRSLSDEEKTVRKEILKYPDVKMNNSQIATMRLNFMSNNLLANDSTKDENELKSPDDDVDDSLNDDKLSKLNSMTVCTNTDNVNVNVNDNDIVKYIDNVNPSKNIYDEDDNNVSYTGCLTATVSLDCKDTKEDYTPGINNHHTNNQCLPMKDADDDDNDDNDVNSVNNVNNKKEEDVEEDDDSKLIEPDSLDINFDSSSIQLNSPNLSITQNNTINLTDNESIDIFNATNIDLSNENNQSDDYPDDKNPFKSDDDDDDNEESKCLNPFGSSDDEVDEKDEKKGETEMKINDTPPTPAIRMKKYDIETSDKPIKRLLIAPKINLNPFLSEDDEDESEDEKITSSTPIPKPRSRKFNLSKDGIYTSNSSLASTSSAATSISYYRKKKPAPPPPLPQTQSPLLSSSINTDKSFSTMKIHSELNSPSNSCGKTPRKNKRAPLPPLLISPYSSNSNLNIDIKEDKNEANKNKQYISTETNYNLYHDKSIEGKWKRKKTRAPSRPIPQKRNVKLISMKEIQFELNHIELQQQGLERQGVRLEQLIRDKFECENELKVDNNIDKDDNHSNNMDVDELVLELFSLVNEKNELFRRQVELILLKRQQRLEEEHADVEYQIRCLMLQPEATKTDFDKQREESLIQRLVDIVEKRSEIIECLDMDRRREVEEDKSINMHMELFQSAKNRGANELIQPIQQHKSKKYFKLKDKIKEKHFNKICKKDADKDIDETEVKLKRQTKKKWF